MPRRSPRPKGWHSVTPRLVADNPAVLVRFLRKAFHATGTSNGDGPAVMKIGDSLVMVGGTGHGRRRPRSSICTSTTPTRHTRER